MENNLIELKTKWQIPDYKIEYWLGRRRDFCVVIPVINEGDRIHSLLKRMQSEYIANISDIIIIDGGSNDGSLENEILKKEDVNGLLIKTGAGKLSSQLRIAYSFAIEQGYIGVITIDGNDKDNPKHIPAFISALKIGVDFVQGSRFVPGGISQNTPKSRVFAIRFVHAPILSLASGFKWTDTTQGFRGYSRRLLIDERLSIFRDIFREYELLAYINCRAPKLNFNCIELPTSRVYPNGHIPTKIKGIRGQLRLLKVLFETCFKRYNP
ncbi:MAG: glycosyltransferase [Candidatus Cloacimonetes bacterium]|nr:glycosyltransferase [Candidatus Cloacimonadota bacterium]